MLIKKKASSSKNTVLVLLFVLVFGALGYLLYTNFLSPVNVDISESETGSGATVTRRKLNTEIDQAFLEEKSALQMRVYGDVPVRVRALGKQDLFGLQ
ncbi:MAG: hypothetical protein G01um101418_615 [Parcubacteria group bacterium Gr01-1014_18]|nr:MAG: hypothetical protein Greene041636_94 [Parcubacteria group bacterium Greene0416_36]TSC80867.1 MAG: hypothetical protein G01um101418_615 [Parcubacteria group bacterium Gr01-1014_18]TSC99528.1 MAG: hypothetical protein Greene101420_195 [Parcubacteria group bacterium Greene1014_20]TSD07553.1 MAG: hypothetical protein Greene07142_10 [Parcubacteria group bacterium Greene0714_2]